LTIRLARREIAKYLRRNPGLQSYPTGCLAEAYAYAREDAPDETDLPLTAFPEACLWTLDPVLAANFWPEG
jgi:hypothetical protein